MANETCILNSITLAAGETFILPKGATLVGSTDNDSIESECQDLNNLEDLSCFSAALGSYHGNSNGVTEYFEADNIRCYGYKLNGIFYEFPSAIINSGAAGSFDMIAIGNYLKAAIPSILSFSVNYKIDTSRGSLSAISIKTIPSIANNLILVASTFAPIGGPATGGSIYTYESIFRPSTDANLILEFDPPICP